MNQTYAQYCDTRIRQLAAKHSRPLSVVRARCCPTRADWFRLVLAFVADGGTLSPIVRRSLNEYETYRLLHDYPDHAARYASVA